MGIETSFDAKSKQYHFLCHHCGGEMTSFEEIRGFPNWCYKCVKTTMLKAPAKHGVSLGEHHAKQREQKYQEALRTLEALPNWRNDMQQFGQGFKKWIDHHYHEIMLALMILDVILLTWIAIKK